MKKALILGVCLMLIGCSSATAQGGASRFAEITTNRVSGYGIVAFEDTQTGCQYIMTTNGGIVPLYGIDGKVLCR